jgi:hydroxyacid-oxoacid transhydrogenase
MTEHETVFTLEATPVTFGAGASLEAGYELRRLGVTRALLVTDPGVAEAGHVEPVRAAVGDAGIDVVVFDAVKVEPTLESFEAAVAAALEAGVDGFLSVGGGSSIDTAKAANLGSTHPAPLMTYVNPPVGDGKPPPGPLRPHVAVPTTCGSGSEATTVAVLDVPERQVKTGISHRLLRASRALVDPALTRSLPAEVVAATGLDVVCHAAESFTARPFDSRDKPSSPAERPPYQGSNPVADVWSAKALEDGGRYLRRAVADPDDVEARGAMMLAATLAGIGFGSAGVHIPHACAYPIAGRRRIAHGRSVIVTAPAAFRFTESAAPERHRRAARLLGGGDSLPDALLSLMRDVGAPSGIAEIGYGEEDIPELVEGALAQRRLLAVAPREPDAEDLAGIFRASLRWW